MGPAFAEASADKAWGMGHGKGHPAAWKSERDDSLVVEKIIIPSSARNCVSLW